jgi:parvulin-like peptidyl-prolyl isomerase
MVTKLALRAQTVGLTGAVLFCAAVMLLALMACRGQEAPPVVAARPVATVNGERIELKEFEKELAAKMALAKGEMPLKPEQYARLKEEVLGRLVEERIMLQRGRELLVTVSEAELDARIEEIRKDYADGTFNALFSGDTMSFSTWKKALLKRMLLEKVVAGDVNAKVQVADAEAEARYKANRKLYAADRRARAVQIVVRDRDRAEAILKRLKAGEEFDKVAREVSIGPEAAKGGDLGFFAQGVMPEAIDRLVFSLPVGKLSGVVQSPYGFHIFKVLGREEGGGRKFAEAKERVVADLRKLKEAEAYGRWLEALKGRATVVVNRPLPDGPAPAGTIAPAPGSGKH